MKKLKSFSGFSLMEMMVVLLIVAVVMAAAAPMVSRKMANSIANGGGSDSFWEQLNGVGRRSIGYNAQQVNNRDTVVIGERNPGFPANTDIPRFVVSSNSAGVPQIRLRENLLVNPRNLDINFSNESVLVTNDNTQSRQAVVVGFGAQGGTNTDSTAVGYQADSTGNMSTAVGYQAQATAPETTALGHASRATSRWATAVGRNSQATMEDTTAVGFEALATGDMSTALGYQAVSAGARSLALGHASKAPGDNSVALGTSFGSTNCTARANSVSVGTAAFTADGAANAVAIGFRTNAGANSVAIGGPFGLGNQENTRAGSNAVAIGGRGTNASANNSIAIGASSTVDWSYDSGIAIGSPFNNQNCTAGQNDVAIGRGAFAAVSGSHVATNSIAIGVSAYTHSANAIAIGSRTNDKVTTAATDAIAIGTAAQSLSDDSVAIGRAATADNAAKQAIAIGQFAKAFGERSIAIGSNAQAKKPDTIAIGALAVADQDNEITLGTTGKTVYIPGDLIVGGNVYLNTASRQNRTYIRVNTSQWSSQYGYIDKDTGDSGLYIQRYPTSDSSSWSFQSNGSWYSLYSDRRLKNVGEAFKGGLSELKKLEFFHYTFKEDKTKTPRVGVMAQDLQKVFPDAVIKGEDGFLRIRLEDMFYAVINAVKELDTRLTALTEQVKSNIDLTAKLQKQVNEQSEQIAELKKQNAEFEKRLAKLERKARKGNVEE